MEEAEPPTSGGDENDENKDDTNNKNNNFASTFVNDVSDFVGDVNDIVDNVSDMVEEKVQQLMKRSTFAGKIFPVLSKFIITPRKAREVLGALRQEADPLDVLLIWFFGWALVPIMEWPYNHWIAPQLPSHHHLPPLSSPPPPPPPPPEQALDLTKTSRKASLSSPFRRTRWFPLVDYTSQIAKIAMLVYALDCFSIMLTCLGFHLHESVSKVFAKVAYVVWFTRRLQVLKTHIIQKSCNPHGSSNRKGAGRAKIINHLVDAVLLASSALFVLDILQVEGGMALKSVFAFGSVGTLLIGLASQDMASNVVNGLVLSASDKYYEGDVVQFGNNDQDQGTVVSMGWINTVLRKSDESLVSIPNSELANKRVANLSRVQWSAVYQTLVLDIADLPRLNGFLTQVKEEIRRAVGRNILIDNKEDEDDRPFEATWTSFGPNNALQVTVSCHLRIPPVGLEYGKVRQAVLRAIHRAMKKQKISLVPQNDNDEEEEDEEDDDDYNSDEEDTARYSDNEDAAHNGNN